jgi:tetratricopeptide (TPR) repeat protein
LRDESQLSDSERRAAKYYLTQTFVNSAERREEKSEFEDAARDFARAVEVLPDYADIRFRLGKALERLGRTDDAIEEYRQALRCNACYLDAGVALAFCLLRAGRHEEAAEAFGQALEVKIDQVRKPYEKGLERLRNGSPETAEDHFHDAFLSMPHKFEEHYRSALEFLKSEEYEKALIELEKALELNSKYPDIHNFRGVALCELGRLEEGITAFRRSIDLKPDFVVPKLNLAFALLRAGDYKESETELEAVLEADPTLHAASVKLEELRTGRAAEIRRSAPRGGLTS